MSAPEVYSIAQTPITCHAFNADRSQVALSLNDDKAQIYVKEGREWVATETLAEHDKAITSIDWAPNSNRIVTASQDRNAYVWSQSPDPLTGKMMWKPTLVLLRINRAATYVRWSPNEDKFAVASGARAIALKKPIRSTVLSVDWHPNNVLLAAGSADMKAPAPTVWGEKLPFSTICGEYTSPAGGWVHTVSFSPSGDVLAFASHDSSISIVYPEGPVIQSIRISTLPYVTLTWTSEESIVAAGHDCQPVVFSGTEAGWGFVGSLDDTTGGGKSAAKGGSVGRLNSSAFNAFRNADTRGHAGGVDVSAGTELLTVHQNTITSVRPFEWGSDGSVSRVSTSGVDGKLVIWNVVPVSVAGVAGRFAGMRV
ncbi:WD40-repeat-containing domain protein [Boletus reticuloceps]|uniref:Arp2/3 complex 41 kDa subunit n=1 Tax=Boletus reticuloceps TaxID=495285 RepID=A0A8I2YT69_9AGAM|nr:WD40-repeat-containing domain protein [Boletus reticuloceps]